MTITRRQALTLSASALALPPRLAQADEAALYAAAKAEKEVVWYTTLIVNQAVRPIIDAFQAKYPGVTVRYNRADSVPTAIKIIDESRAGAPQADVFDGIETEPPVAAAGFVAPYVSAHAGLYPPALRDANGLWIATNLYFLTPGYNTNLVKPSEAPKTLDDLLDPRWKGKIVWSNARSAGGPIFVGSVLRHLGEDKGMAWLEQFSRQQVVNAYITARAVLDQVIAGEYALHLQPPCGAQRPEGRAGRLDQAQPHRGAHAGDESGQELRPSQCGQAADRLHRVRAGPEGAGGRRLSARHAQRRSQDPEPQTREGRFHAPLFPARRAWPRRRPLGPDLQDPVPLNDLLARNGPPP